jgi:hypothetical protein
MFNDKGGIKYPKQLAVNETSSRRQIDQLELFDDSEPDPLITELKKSLYTFNAAYSTIFDGLSFVCTTLFDKKWQDAVGEWHDIIGRQNDNTETHYRLFAPEEFIKHVFTGPYAEEWPEVRNQLLKLALNTEKKKLAIDKTHYIIDAPIKVVPWYDKDDIGKFTNLSPRRNGKTKEEREEKERQTGKAQGRIIGFSIEFFKPLFRPLLEANSKNRTGGKYLITPPYFQLNLNRLHRTFVIAAKGGINEQKQEMKEQALSFTDTKSETTEAITPLDVRQFYLALALKDNHKGDYITIENLIEFIDGIWPGLIRIDSNGNKTLQPAHYKEVIEKINRILQYLKMMGHKGNMDGGQIVPLEIVERGENGEEFTRETNRLRIRCIKQKTLYSRYKPENLLENFAQEHRLAGQLELKKALKQPLCGVTGIEKSGFLMIFLKSFLKTFKEASGVRLTLPPPPKNSPYAMRKHTGKRQGLAITGDYPEQGKNVGTVRTDRLWVTFDPEIASVMRKILSFNLR